MKIERGSCASGSSQSSLRYDRVRDDATKPPNGTPPFRQKNPGLLGITLKKPGFGGNESAGARTQDPGIKSPLLYQLSYALILPNSTQVGGIP